MREFRVQSLWPFVHMQWLIGTFSNTKTWNEQSAYELDGKI